MDSEKSPRFPAEPPKTTEEWQILADWFKKQVFNSLVRKATNCGLQEGDAEDAVIGVFGRLMRYAGQLKIWKPPYVSDVASIGRAKRHLGCRSAQRACRWITWTSW